MLINEVESVVGLSKKSIRYYEEMGLFTPRRINNNTYRDYTDDDVIVLKKIKFLRELDVSISEIKKIIQGEVTLGECMKDRISALEVYEANYQKIRHMCAEISNTNVDFNGLKIDKYLKEMNILNKEGFIMRDVKKDQSKRIAGAIVSSVVFILFFMFFAFLITYFQMTEVEKMPMVLYVFFMAMFIIPSISVLINLIERVKEIKGGEEDEASKY